MIYTGFTIDDHVLNVGIDMQITISRRESDE